MGSDTGVAGVREMAVTPDMDRERLALPVTISASLLTSEAGATSTEGRETGAVEAEEGEASGESAVGCSESEVRIGVATEGTAGLMGGEKESFDRVF